MAEKTVYDLIKKQNGERFAKAIRNYDNGIFDVPGIVDIVKYAGRDAEPIMNYLVALKKIRVQETNMDADPFTLLYSAGYDAVYADTLERQNAIRPYFAENEELCTFRDPERYKKYYIVNVVRKDVDSIRREDFKNPQREDEYGTSVMSIQMLKTGGFISIKNRYNHTVENPDNTYDSNPDNIVPGLADSLRKHFNVDFSSKNVSLPDGYVMMGPHIVKYNAERNNVYYGADFVAWDGQVVPIDKRSQFILDDFIFDVSNGGAKNKNDFPDGAFDEAGAFMTAWRQVAADKKLHVSKTEAGATRIATDDGVWIDVRDGKIVGLAMPGLTDVPNYFMKNNLACQTINLPVVESIGSGVLEKNQDLTEIDLPRVKKIGGYFLRNNHVCRKINLPAAESIGRSFLVSNQGLTEIDLPNAKDIGRSFLRNNQVLSKLNMPKVENIGMNFLEYNRGLTEIDLPQVKNIGKEFLWANHALCKLNLPNVENIDDGFMESNSALETISLPRVEKIGDKFIACNNKLRRAELPNVRVIGSDFMLGNRDMAALSLPRAERIGDNFLLYNKGMARLSMPNVCEIGWDFLHANAKLPRLVLPSIKKIGPWFLVHNEQIKVLQGVKPENRGQVFMDAMANRDKTTSFNKGRTLLQKMMGVLDFGRGDDVRRDD